MKGPSIAVMLGGHAEPDGDEAHEPGLPEAKSGAKDAAKALISAVKVGDPEAVYRAFRSLSALCEGMDDLEDSGESDEGKSGEEYAKPEEG